LQPRCGVKQQTGKDCDINGKMLSPVTNDYALCKLDKPVYVDDTKVQLVLDTADANKKPLTNTTATAIGFGMLQFDWENIQRPDLLQSVELDIIDSTNDKCSRMLNKVVANRTMMEDSTICAWKANKDACIGDSGGPLVERHRLNDGQQEHSAAVETHVHVGITSWGVGCAREKFAGMYARTSHAADWIFQTICDDNSVAATNTAQHHQSLFCATQNPKSRVTCPSSTTSRKLTIKIVTDSNPERIGYTLKEVVGNNETATAPIRSVTSGELTKPFYTYGDIVCLSAGSAYEFEIVSNTTSESDSNNEERSSSIETMSLSSLDGFLSLTITDDNNVDEVVHSVVSSNNKNKILHGKKIQFQISDDGDDNETDAGAVTIDEGSNSTKDDMVARLCDEGSDDSSLEYLWIRKKKKNKAMDCSDIQSLIDENDDEGKPKTKSKLKKHKRQHKKLCKKKVPTPITDFEKEDEITTSTSLRVKHYCPNACNQCDKRRRRRRRTI
jgi:hypothetical protein